MHRLCVALGSGTLLLSAACGSPGGDDPSAANPLVDRPDSATVAAASVEGVELVVHRDPSCPCCGGWQEVMSAAGFEVREEHHADMDAVKDEHDIPVDQRSCHTTTVEGYSVEGHVPVEALVDLLDSRPAIDGIALAGMPAGSPGMPGTKAGPLVVTTIVDGEVTGELGRY